jgi:hypothetical protein
MPLGDFTCVVTQEDWMVACKGAAAEGRSWHVGAQAVATFAHAPFVQMTWLAGTQRWVEVGRLLSYKQSKAQRVPLGAGLVTLTQSQ